MNTTPNGYFEYQNAIEVSDLTPQERLLALTYASSYNWEKQNDSFCGIYRLAAMTGLSKSRISEYKKSLIAKGWLDSNRRFSKTSVTRPTIPDGFDVKAEKAKQDALVEEQNQANKKRVAKARTKKDDEIATLRAQLAALQPQTTPEVQENPEDVVEAQEAVQAPEMTDEEAKRILDHDDFGDEPLEIAPVVKEGKKDLIKEMFEARKAKRSFAEDFVAQRLAESGDPEKAQEFFDSEELINAYPDEMQRAAQAAFKVMLGATV